MTSTSLSFRNSIPSASLFHLRRLGDKLDDLRNPEPVTRRTSLAIAVEAGRLDVVEWLLDAGHEDTDLSRDSTGAIILHLAAARNDLEVLDIYLERFSFTLDYVDRLLKTPLHVAAEKGHLEAAQLLIERGADIDAPDARGETPLHYASSWGHTEMIKLLIDHGCQFAVKNAEDFTPADFAYSFEVQHMLEKYARAHVESTKRSKRQVRENKLGRKHSGNPGGLVLDVSGTELDSDPSRTSTPAMPSPSITRSHSYMSEMDSPSRPNTGNRSASPAVTLASPSGLATPPISPATTGGLPFSASNMSLSPLSVRSANGGRDSPSSPTRSRPSELLPLSPVLPEEGEAKSPTFPSSGNGNGGVSGTQGLGISGRASSFSSILRRPVFDFSSGGGTAAAPPSARSLSFGSAAPLAPVPERPRPPGPIVTAKSPDPGGLLVPPTPPPTEDKPTFSSPPSVLRKERPEGRSRSSSNDSSSVSVLEKDKERGGGRLASVKGAFGFRRS